MIDVVKKFRIHKVPVALGMVRSQAQVLIQIHRMHLGKVHFPRLIGADQVGIHHLGDTCTTLAIIPPATSPVSL